MSAIANKIVYTALLVLKDERLADQTDVEVLAVTDVGSKEPFFCQKLFSHPEYTSKITFCKVTADQLTADLVRGKTRVAVINFSSVDIFADPEVATALRNSLLVCAVLSNNRISDLIF